MWYSHIIYDNGVIVVHQIGWPIRAIVLIKFFCILDSSQHLQGPLDGSLYATILKSPKTPERISTPHQLFPFPTAASSLTNSTSNNHPLTPAKPQRTGSTQNLISPPPEFSNNKIIELTSDQQQQRYHTINGNNKGPLNTSTPIQYSASGKQVLNRSHSYTPTPVTNVSYEEIRIPVRSSSRDITQRSSYSTHSQSQTPVPTRPSSSQSNYQDVQRSSVSRASNYTPTPTSHQIRTIESYHYSNVADSQSHHQANGGNNYVDGGRESSVRSPLTLSMDSGISSSGIVNSKLKLS